ncbi:MAG: hypothetical protein EXR79_15910 [Myxococcales bacterium]|nr:hypothetical protein [Myxococcales bacterium]
MPARSSKLTALCLAARALLVFAAGAGGWFGCARAPADVVADESLVHLEAAVGLLQTADGDTFELAKAVTNYRAEHRGELRALRERGEDALRALDDEGRRAVETRAKNKATPLLARLEAESRKFKDPRMALRLVRPLIVPATPRPPAVGAKPSFLPEIPDLPAGAEPPPPPPPDPHAGNDHGPLPAPAAALPAVVSPAVVPAPSTP